MKDKQEVRFPGAIEWAALGFCAALAVHSGIEQQSAVQAEALTPPPALTLTREPYPTMIPSDQLPIAIRRPELDKKPYSKESR